MESFIEFHLITLLKAKTVYFINSFDFKILCENQYCIFHWSREKALDSKRQRDAE